MTLHPTDPTGILRTVDRLGLARPHVVRLVPDRVREAKDIVAGRRPGPKCSPDERDRLRVLLDLIAERDKCIADLLRIIEEDGL